MDIKPHTSPTIARMGYKFDQGRKQREDAYTRRWGNMEHNNPQARQERAGMHDPLRLAQEQHSAARMAGQTTDQFDRWAFNRQQQSIADTTRGMAAENVAQAQVLDPYQRQMDRMEVDRSAARADYRRGKRRAMTGASTVRYDTPGTASRI